MQTSKSNLSGDDKQDKKKVSGQSDNLNKNQSGLKKNADSLKDDGRNTSNKSTNKSTGAKKDR